MPECDACGETVMQVWTERRRTESLTHCTYRDVCRSCHPRVPVSGATVPMDRVVVTDGGATASFGCPICAGPTIDGQGLYDCLDCEWTGVR